MAVLTVLGRGSWRYRNVKYPAGVHEVPDDVAGAAQRSGITFLHVSNVSPEFAEAEEGPLTMADLKTGRSEGLELARPAPEPVAAPVVERVEVPAKFPCPVGGCDRAAPGGFPSAAALDRHTKLHHSE